MGQQDTARIVVRGCRGRMRTTSSRSPTCFHAEEGRHGHLLALHLSSQQSSQLSSQQLTPVSLGELAPATPARTRHSTRTQHSKAAPPPRATYAPPGCSWGCGSAAGRCCAWLRPHCGSAGQRRESCTWYRRPAGTAGHPGPRVTDNAPPCCRPGGTPTRPLGPAGPAGHPWVLHPRLGAARVNWGASAAAQ
jgi:hypothetical protein